MTELEVFVSTVTASVKAGQKKLIFLIAALQLYRLLLRKLTAAIRLVTAWWQD